MNQVHTVLLVYCICNNSNFKGTFVECKYPYPREINEFEEYHEVTCHFIYGEEDEQLPESSSVGLSVSVYLIKQLLF